MRELLIGRELLETELPDDFFECVAKDTLIRRSGWEKIKDTYYCRRCGSSTYIMQPSFCICQKACGYCRNCMQLGRIKKCSMLYSLPTSDEPLPEARQHALTWEGTLSTQQQHASKSICQAIHSKSKVLLHAVAGAGKTEMLFDGIYQALQANLRVCIASPRVDVCLELAPRFRDAFKKTELAVLHGKSKKSYRYTPLVIATTHQLLRFKEAFDVLIIDEVDAFPYHHEPMLAYGAQKCVKKEHALIYLTATPSLQLKCQFDASQIITLPARYHGYPLPEPHLVWCGPWKKILHQKRAYKHPLTVKIAELIKKKRRFLVFCPEIEWMVAYEKKLHQLFPHCDFTSVSAEDKLREEKVLAMRQERYQFSLTTTILERGVTFSNIDVLVIGAEDRLFDEAALIQIAGRAGRDFRYPKGEVIFFHNGRTRCMNAAQKQIKKLNQLARQRGLLHE
ncbi:DEAD/DEAH box helicase [Allofustis seminis]|uniref:DEAD/DEAH box helicase n=1 Tax=Allofustis seminis TaxID=166939 RepID=UPI00036A6871|nr:DEAD/DEAH box helicase family protein [Allofustis seminis]